MTLGEFRKLTSKLPDKTLVCYHAYDKGCCLGTYDLKEVWIFRETEAVVLNPEEDYDGRKPPKTATQEESNV